MEPGEETTIIVGPNAAGKTNIIEAVQLLTSTESFRNPSWAECVRWGQDEASLELTVEGDERKRETRLSISSGGRRDYWVNNTPRKRVSDVAGLLPCVVFSPDDLRMVKDSADRRRAAIDGVGDQLSKAYSSLRGEYERTVRQRNAALRDPHPEERVISALSEKLIETGTVFSGHRKRLFDRVSRRLSEAYLSLAPDENLTATYRSSWTKRGLGEEDPGAFSKALSEVHNEEMARGMTLVGPHRDEITFEIDSRDARVFSSQGQQRTIALAWKLAEVSVITEVGGQPPILLLDDVMSELDEERRLSLASFVGEAAQTLVTTTNLGYFDQDIIDRAHIVSL